MNSEMHQNYPLPIYVVCFGSASERSHLLTLGATTKVPPAVWSGSRALACGGMPSSATRLTCFDEVGGPLRHSQHRKVEVRPYRIGHNRCVADAESLDAVNLAVLIHHSQRVVCGPHFARARYVVGSYYLSLHPGIQGIVGVQDFV